MGFYSQFGNFNTRNIFSTGDTKTHIQKKKNISKIYSKSNVIQSGVYISAKVDKAWIQIDKNLGKPMNVYSLFLALALDVVSGFEYGPQYSTNFITDLDHTREGKAHRNELFLGFQESSSMWFYTTLAPMLWDTVARWYGIGEKSAKSQQWIWDKFQEALKPLQQGIIGSSTNDNTIVSPVGNVLSTMYDEKIGKGPISQTQFREIASEIADHVIAGHETTGITLTYICWELSRPCNRHWQDKLFEECKTVPSDLQRLDQMPILHSIVQEACRLHSAIPGSEPRYVPQEGPKFEATLRDKHGTRVEIPPGTIVSCQPWSLHLLETPFGANPRQFNPARWLRDETTGETEQEYEKRLTKMNNSMFTFGQGNRMCLGMNLALMEMKYCIAQLYSRYTTDISPEWCNKVYQQQTDSLMGTSGRGRATSIKGTDVDLMRMADTYTTRPLMNECWLEFSSRD